MAAIDQITNSDLGAGLGGIGTAVLDDVKARVLDQAKKAAWRWYETNKDRAMYSKKIWFFPTIQIRVGDLRFLFVELFGAQP